MFLLALSYREILNKSCKVFERFVKFLGHEKFTVLPIDIRFREYYIEDKEISTRKSRVLKPQKG